MVAIDCGPFEIWGWFPGFHAIAIEVLNPLSRLRQRFAFR
jgi:hypothetical protein